MNMRKKAGLLAVVAMLTLSISAGAADNPNNLMITADSLSYDGTSGKADAVGNVVITQADKTMTGASGWYNVKTREADLNGGVSMIGTDMAMAASSVHSFNDNQFQAKGNVHLQRQNRQIYGDTVDYNTATEYGLVTGNARLIADGTTLTGNTVEGWMKEIRAVANGNVTFDSPARNASGSADHATYTQTPNQDDGLYCSQAMQRLYKMVMLLMRQN